MKLPLRLLLVIVSAAAGGAIGHFVFEYLVKSHGLYGLALPGLGIGIGASCAKNPSRILAVVLGVAALGLTLYSEWDNFKFIADPSWDYFLRNLGKLTILTKIMIVGGVLAAVWLAWPFASRRRTN
ncbi:MAG: hypothetical protein AAF585_09390 [Verrucomicrobiota bacterium]